MPDLGQIDQFDRHEKDQPGHGRDGHKPHIGGHDQQDEHQKHAGKHRRNRSDRARGIIHAGAGEGAGAGIGLKEGAHEIRHALAHNLLIGDKFGIGHRRKAAADRQRLQQPDHGNGKGPLDQRQNLDRTGPGQGETGQDRVNFADCANIRAEPLGHQCADQKRNHEPREPFGEFAEHIGGGKGHHRHQKARAVDILPFLGNMGEAFKDRTAPGHHHTHGILDLADKNQHRSGHGKAEHHGMGNETCQFPGPGEAKAKLDDPDKHRQEQCCGDEFRRSHGILTRERAHHHGRDRRGRARYHHHR